MIAESTAAANRRRVGCIVVTECNTLVHVFAFFFSKYSEVSGSWNTSKGHSKSSEIPLLPHITDNYYRSTSIVTVHCAVSRIVSGLQLLYTPHLINHTWGWLIRMSFSSTTCRISIILFATAYGILTDKQTPWSALHCKRGYFAINKDDDSSSCSFRENKNRINNQKWSSFIVNHKSRRLDIAANLCYAVSVQTPQPLQLVYLHRLLNQKYLQIPGYLYPIRSYACVLIFQMT